MDAFAFNAPLLAPLLVPRRRRRDIDASDAIWFRPIRGLLLDGKRIDPTAYFHVQLPDGTWATLGAMSVTTRGRAIYRPVMPLKSPRQPTQPDVTRAPIEHLTLEMASGKWHSTMYDFTGRKVATAFSGRAITIRDQDACAWFACGVSIDDLRRERDGGRVLARAPGGDRVRREEEFKSFVREMKNVSIPIPDGPADPVFVYYAVILCRTPIRLRLFGELADFVRATMKGMLIAPDPVDAPLKFGVGRAQLRDRHVFVVVACPNAKLRESGLIAVAR